MFLAAKELQSFGTGTLSGYAACTLHSAQCTVHSAHYKLHTTNYTLHTTHCTQYIAHYPLHTEIFILNNGQFSRNVVNLATRLSGYRQPVGL